MDSVVSDHQTMGFCKGNVFKKNGKQNKDTWGFGFIWDDATNKMRHS